MSLTSDVDEKLDTAMIRGFEIIVYTTLSNGRRVQDYRIQYGASPIRDFNSMMLEIDRLIKLGEYFTVHPIMET